MTPITADCDLSFHPAVHSSGLRPLSQIWWIVMHDEESPNAKSAAEYFRDPASGGSAHLCVDDTICYRCLDNETIPWGAASSFGANTHGFHIEQAGYASYSLVIWKRHLNTLQRAAYKAAFHAHKFGIPLQFVDAAGLLRGEHGITTHAQVSKASRQQDPAHAGDYSHSDPGAFWPRIMFMYLVRRYAKQMT